MKKMSFMIAIVMVFSLFVNSSYVYAGQKVDNLSYTFYDANGTSYSTAASSGHAKVIIFGYSGCYACSYLLKTLNSNGKKHKKVDLLYVDFTNPGAASLVDEGSGYSIKNLHFVSGTDAYTALWDYADAYPGAKTGSTVYLPLSFYIDSKNKIVGVNPGYCDVDEKISSVLGISDDSDEGQSVTNEDNTSDNDTAGYDENCPDGNCDASIDVSSMNLSANKNKRKLTVKWTKNPAVDYYELQISTKKNFKGAKTIKVGKNKKKYTKKKIKTGKRYYVRIRGIRGQSHSYWKKASVKAK